MKTISILLLMAFSASAHARGGGGILFPFVVTGAVIIFMYGIMFISFGLPMILMSFIVPRTANDEKFAMKVFHLSLWVIWPLLVLIGYKDFGGGWWIALSFPASFYISGKILDGDQKSS